MNPLEDHGSEFFTPKILSLVFLLAYMSTKLYEGWFGNFISLTRREIRRRINRRRRRRREPTAALAKLRQRLPNWKSHSAPTKEVATPSSRSRIFRIAIILVTIQFLPEILAGLGLSDEISTIISYGILNNSSSYSWLQWSLILSVGYLIVESTFESENFHLFTIPIVFLSTMVIPGTFPNPLFFAYCFLFMSILQAMKLENSNVTVLGLSSDIRDYIGQKKCPANLFAVSLIQGRHLQLIHAQRHVDADGNIHLALANSRWSFLRDDPKDRSRGIFYWLLFVAFVVIYGVFIDGSFADGDAAIIWILIALTLLCLALTYHGIIFATWVWYLISIQGFTEIFSEIPGTLIALVVIYIVFYPMRHYFNNRKIMGITNLISVNFTPRERTLKGELSWVSHGWTRKIYIWIKLGICGLLNNLIVSLICTIQLLVGLLVLIINAIYLFITGWLRSFGFSVPIRHAIIPFGDIGQFIGILPIVLFGTAASIFHGILAPWVSTYWLFKKPVPRVAVTDRGLRWYLFRNSESADYPVIYYLVGAISWLFCFPFIVSIVGTLLIAAVLLMFVVA